MTHSVEKGLLLVGMNHPTIQGHIVAGKNPASLRMPECIFYITSIKTFFPSTVLFPRFTSGHCFLDEPSILHIFDTIQHALLVRGSLSQILATWIRGENIGVTNG